MLTKPSPDAMKMLNSISEHFNKAFDNNEYSSLFRREFRRLFRIDMASDFSIIGRNDVFIFGLGIIDCYEFEKNIKCIENRVNAVIKKKEQGVSWFERIVALVETDIIEGRLDNAFVEVFHETLDKVNKWKETDDAQVSLPRFLNKLKGDAHFDYRIVQKELSRKIGRKKVFDSSTILYQELCDWINSPLTKKQYGCRCWNAMKEKLALRGKDWFGLGGVTDFESAKRIISEVFYPDQEQYYKELEKWASCEIEDKNCSNWIDSFLWKGRTIPIRQVQVLKYKGDLDKGKEFLISKYEEKLRRDKKKIQNREFRHSSLFDTFDDDYNSFQEIWTSLENKYSLFPVGICSNVEYDKYPKLSMFGDWTDGVKIQHDTIHYNLVLEDMTLSSTNNFFYTYRCKYKQTNKRYILYSDRALELIKKYLIETISDEFFNENVVGCITMLDYSSKLYPKEVTALLSYSKDNFNPLPRIIVNYDKKKRLVAEGFQNTLGFRLFTNAAIYHVAKKIEHSLFLPLDKTLSDYEFKLLLDDIESKQNVLSYEDRYLCHFIDSSKYKFPTEEASITDVFRLSRSINLFHNVQHHYSTPVFQERMFPFGKIVGQYKNYELENNTNRIGNAFYMYRDETNLWFDKSNRLFLFNLRTLCYLNWVFVNSDTWKIKKLSALWLYNILYTCHLEAYQKDKAFFSSLLYYELIQNERIYIIVIDKLIENDNTGSLCKYDSSSFFYHLVRFYSNSFKGWGKELSYPQLKFLNGGKKKHELLTLFSKERTCNITINDAEVFKIASKVFEYIKNLLCYDKYSHSEILELFKNMNPFDIPNNFVYRESNTHNNIDLNGDYSGSYVHDVMGYTNDEIDTIFDGFPDAYWNID